MNSGSVDFIIFNVINVYLMFIQTTNARYKHTVYFGKKLKPTQQDIAIIIKEIKLKNQYTSAQFSTTNKSALVPKEEVRITSSQKNSSAASERQFCNIAPIANCPRNFHKVTSPQRKLVP